MNSVPQELNWVEKRAACTVAEVFNELRSGIDDDVAIMNAARQLTTGTCFSATLLQSGTGVVIGRPKQIPNRRVLVAIAGDKLQVKDEGSGSDWSASVALNNEGRCILRLEDGVELEQWQFRKKALEGLFFGD